MANHFKEQTTSEEKVAEVTPPKMSMTATPMKPAMPRRKSAGHRVRKPSRGRRRPSKRSRLLSNILIAVGVVLLVVAVGMWGMQQWRYHEQDVVNRELAVYATVHDNALDTPVSQAPDIDWKGLKAVNDDVVGWLQIPGTTINYPVYQGEDNEHYLRHSATGEWTLGGQLFIDCDNTAPGMVDQVTMVYGHHLLDGSMFEQIAALDDQERFDEIKTVWYVTEDQAYELEPLMVYYVHEYDETARAFRFKDGADFKEFLTGCLAGSVTSRSDAEQILAGTSHVLSLVTCNYYAEYENHGRTIVVCVPKNEAAAATGE